MSDDRPTIFWTRPKLEAFKKALAESEPQLKNNDAFTFEGNEYVVAYARYLIEYLEGLLKQ